MGLLAFLGTNHLYVTYHHSLSYWLQVVQYEKPKVDWSANNIHACESVWRIQTGLQHNQLNFLSWGLVYTGLDSSFRSEKACLCEYGSLLSSLQHLKIRRKNLDDFLSSKGVGKILMAHLFYYTWNDQTKLKARGRETESKG